MQTLTTVGRRGWSGRIASLPLSFFFLSFFCFLCQACITGRTVSQIWINKGSKRVVPLKEVPFGGLKNVPINFGGKIRKKLQFWGREYDFQA